MELLQVRQRNGKLLAKSGMRFSDAADDNENQVKEKFSA